MNHIYRLVRSRVTGFLIAVSELTKSPGASATRGRKVRSSVLASVLLAVTFAASVSVAEPTGGNVTAGTAAIATSGSNTTINQTSQSAIINWQSFDIASHESVQFLQPNVSSVALNRVLGPDATQIMGNLSSNGKIFLINPNGVLFGQSAQVNVGGLIASTRNITDENFLAGRLYFAGSSDANVANYGSIIAQEGSDGGYVALLGAQVSNQGLISARLGSIALASGDALTLDTAGDGLLNVTVNAGAIRSLVDNGGLLRADGGQVVMTARSASALVQSVVNNTGTVQAQTIENRNGVIRLLGDLDSGVVNVGGRLDASAPLSGNGGFVDTSAAHVVIASDAEVTTLASNGITGNWLVDPVDFTIAASGGDMTGAQLSTNLVGSNITILSSSGASGVNGDIHVNDTVTWSTNRLTLSAHHNININTAMMGSGAASLALLYGQGAVAAGNTSTVSVNAPVNLAAGNNFSTQLGSNGAVVNYTVITSLGAAGSTTGTDLQGINGSLAGNYVLGSNINASSTSGWNAGAGFVPIGNDPSRFTGIFDGLGHTVSGIYINRTGNVNFTGLFGYTAANSIVRNVGLLGGSVSSDAWGTGPLVGALGGLLYNSYATTNVTAFQTAGGLVGVIDGGLIDSSHASGTVFSSGNGEVGGLVGLSWGPGGGAVRNSYATGNVSSTVGNVGGLMGINWGAITNSYATGTATGTNYIGGLVGNNSNGSTTGSYATGAVSGTNYVGGLVGNNSNSVTNSYATGNVTAAGVAGGVAGRNVGTFTNNYATGDVATTGGFTGGLIGSNNGTVTQSYATGNVTGTDQIAGLVGGHNSGSISYSYASGAVIATTGASGGLVGYSAAPISNSYATGAVTGINQVGGILGAMNGSTVTDSYATGNVTGSTSVGGVVGNSTNGTITRAYSSGVVTGTTSVGGLLGSTSGATVTNSFWDLTTSGQATSAGGTGLTTTQMLTGSNFTGFNFTSTPGATGNNWALVNYTGLLNGAGNISGGTRPMLASEYSTTITNAHQLQLIRMDLSAHYTLAASIDLAADLANSSSLWHNGSGGFAPIGTYTGTFDGLGHTINGLMMNRPSSSYGGLFSTVSSTGTVRNVGLVGGIITGAGYTGALVGRLEGAVTNSFATTDVNGAGYAGGLVGLVFATGTLSNAYAGGAVTGVYAGGLVGNNQGAISNSYATGSVTGTGAAGFAGVNPGTIVSSYSMGAVSGSNRNGFVTGGAGTVTDSFWNITTSGTATSFAGTGLTTAQLQAALPTGFSSGTWGNGSNRTTPYLLSNLGPVLIDTDTSATYYNTISTLNQLQNINANLAGRFALVNDIDAGVTSGWNNGSGFLSLGNATTQFTGTFDGMGHVVSNLTINRPTTDYVGLFGYAFASSVNRLGIVNANITGQDYVGAMFGATVIGSVSSNYATGQVSGRNSVGGLIGYNNSMALGASYSTVNVVGANRVGGLMGETNGGTPTYNNYATGSVTASGDYAGGFVGYNGFQFLISDSYATGNVSGTDSVGGFAGYHLDGLIERSYSTGSVAGTSSMGGLVGSTATGQVNDSYWNTTTSGQASSAGGTGLTSTQMQQRANFTGWDFANTWFGYDGHTAPLLRTFMTALTVTANDATKTYDGQAYNGSGGVTYSITPNMSNLLGAVIVTGGTNAGSSATVASGLYSNQQGYIIGYANGTLTTNKAALTAAASAGNKAYDGTATASATLGSLTGLVGTETIGATATSSSFNTKDVATANTVTVTGVSLSNGTNGGLASNYTLASGQTTSANITAKALTATASAGNKTYDGSTTANATLGSIGGLIGTEAIGTAATATFNTKDVATANAVTVSGVSLSDGMSGGLASNYSLASGQTASASITAKALTATASAGNKTYDGSTTASANLGSITGLVGTETVAATATSASFNSKDVATANAVTVNAVALADGTNGGLASNYTLGSGQTASASITAKALTATASSGNKVYDGTTAANATLGSFAGLVGTETVSASGTANFNSKDVATASVVTLSGVSLSDGTNGGLASNYSLASGQTANATITTKALTATASAGNKVYDGTTTANATLGSVTGLVGTETLGTSVTADFNTKDVTTANLVTVSGVTLSDGANGGLASNYTLASGQTASANVSAKALTATANATNKVYDGSTTANATLGSLTGLIGTETVGTTAAASFNSKDVATANVVTVHTATLSDGANGGLATNYSLSSGQIASASITTKALTATASATDKVYDGTDTANATLGSLAGLIGTETLGASATASFNTKDVATANVVTVNGAALADGTNGGLASNYSITTGQTASANVTAKALTAIANTNNKTYDGTTTASTTLGSVTGLVGTETVGTAATAAFNTKDVATANTVTVSGVTLSDGTYGGLASNYSLANGQTASAGITQKVLTATASATNKVYDGTTTASATLGSLTGLIGTETVGTTAAASFNTKDVTTANVVTVGGVTLSDGTNGGLASNYTLSSGQTATASIATKALTATASATDKVYDGTNAASATLGGLTGLIGAETIGASATVSFNTRNVVTANVVTVDGVTLSNGANGGLASNYSLSSGQTANANITQRTLTATASAANKVYDGTTTANASLGSVVGLIGTETLDVAATANFNARDVATANVVTVSGITLADGANGGLASNYSLAGGQTANANITQRALTATASTSGKVYDGTTTAVATLGSRLPLIGSETIGAAATASFNTKDVATANVVTIGGVTLSDGTNGGLASNYSLAGGQTASANITQRALSATAAAASKTYDGTTNADAVLNGLTGFVGSETIVANVTGQFNSRDVATANLVTIDSVTLNDGANGGLASNYSLVTGQTAAANITQRALSVAGMRALDRVYDGTVTATMTGGALVGVVGSDNVSLTSRGSFAAPTAGQQVAVSSESVLGGTDAANYLLVQPSGLSADIHPVIHAAILPGNVSPAAAYESARVSAQGFATTSNVSSYSRQSTSGEVRNFDDLNLTVIGFGLKTPTEWNLSDPDERKKLRGSR